MSEYPPAPYDRRDSMHASATSEYYKQLFVALMVNPVTHDLIVVGQRASSLSRLDDKDWKSYEADIGLFWPAKMELFENDKIRSLGHANAEAMTKDVMSRYTYVTGLARSHSPGGVAFSGIGLGTLLYGGLALATAWGAGIQFHRRIKLFPLNGATPFVLNDTVAYGGGVCSPVNEEGHEGAEFEYDAAKSAERNKAEKARIKAEREYQKTYPWKATGKKIARRLNPTRHVERRLLTDPNRPPPRLDRDAHAIMGAAMGANRPYLPTGIVEKGTWGRSVAAQMWWNHAVNVTKIADRVKTGYAIPEARSVQPSTPEKDIIWQPRKRMEVDKLSIKSVMQSGLVLDAHPLIRGAFGPPQKIPKGIADQIVLHESYSPEVIEFINKYRTPGKRGVFKGGPGMKKNPEPVKHTSEWEDYFGALSEPCPDV